VAAAEEAVAARAAVEEVLRLVLEGEVVLALGEEEVVAEAVVEAEEVDMAEDAVRCGIVFFLSSFLRLSFQMTSSKDRQPRFGVVIFIYVLFTGRFFVLGRRVWCFSNSLRGSIGVHGNKQDNGTKVQQTSVHKRNSASWKD
jgi:hypothetical protein